MTDVITPAEDRSTPPSEDQTPVEWARSNLFQSPGNAVVTVVASVVAAYVSYRAFRFVAVTGQWEIMRVNLENFMIGQYDRDERWRIIAQLLFMAGAGGALAGTNAASARHLAAETGEPLKRHGWRSHALTYWSVALFVLVNLVFFTRTIGPWLVVGGALLAGVAGFAVCRLLPKGTLPVGASIVAVLATVGFQMLSGTGGLAWMFLGLAVAPAISTGAAVLLRRMPSEVGLAAATVGAVVGVGAALLYTGFFTVVAALIGLVGLGLALNGDRIDGGRVGAVLAVGALVAVLLNVIDHTGVDWDRWGGLHLTLLATIGGIGLAFPLGLLLALGRRSELPAVRIMSVGYIEFFRGVPFITLLLSATTFLGFFVSFELPSTMTRAMVATTIFASAYIAEIVRGGLQAVPAGQIEAGQAQGLSRAKIMRLIVLPQALRAVIPAMVGQFISLFKDTSLLSIISVPEFMSQHGIVHAQEAFRSVAIGETLAYLAFGYWSFAFAMSRESQRLEKRLGVGER